MLTPFYTPILPSNRLQIIYFFLGIFLSLSVWRNLYIIFLGSNRFIKRVVFIGSSKRIDEFANELIKGNPHYLVSGYLATDDKNFPTKIETINKDNFLEYLRKNFISEVVVTVDSNKTMPPEVYEVMLQALERGISISEYSEVYENGTNRLPIHFYDKEMFKFFPFSRSNQNKLYLFYTRLFDIVFSLMGLMGLLILLPFILLCNAFGNRGPLFYKQERVGKNGEIFNIVKLRTMVVDAEKEGPVFAKENDTRITKFGKFLRKSRLDEVPQFINVLKGDMAFIGPRPERPVFVEQIAENIPLYKTRHVVKPGLTGWAQVNYPYGENLEDSLMKLRYDLFYIKHRSIFLDVNIL
ncbi:MAG: exopolysaccharide biosynthesis polyprenyl glycosylphosphotransferase [Flavobacterium haoranii]